MADQRRGADLDGIGMAFQQSWITVQAASDKAPKGRAGLSVCHSFSAAQRRKDATDGLIDVGMGPPSEAPVERPCQLERRCCVVTIAFATTSAC